MTSVIMCARYGSTFHSLQKAFRKKILNAEFSVWMWSVKPFKYVILNEFLSLLLISKKSYANNEVKKMTCSALSTHYLLSVSYVEELR